MKMKKVKEMTVCMRTGKVCFRVRSPYNQLIEVTSSIRTLEVIGQSGTMAYEIAHTAMTAVRNELCKQVHKTCLNCELEVVKQAAKKAEKAVREAIRDSHKAYNISSMRVLEGIEGEQLSIFEVHKLYQNASLADADCIAAKQALLEVYKVQHDANRVFKVKQELFNRLYPQDVELDKFFL